MSLGTLQTVKELQKLNKNLSNDKQGEESEELNEEILKCPYSGQIIGKRLKEKIDQDILNEKKEIKKVEEASLTPSQ
jgi:hypothetical protein